MANRLIFALIGLMLIPLLLVGYIVLASPELLFTPATLGNMILAHSSACLLIGAVITACIIVASIFSR